MLKIALLTQFQRIILVNHCQSHLITVFLHFLTFFCGHCLLEFTYPKKPGTAWASRVLTILKLAFWKMKGIQTVDKIVKSKRGFSMTFAMIFYTSHDAIVPMLKTVIIWIIKVNSDFPILIVFDSLYQDCMRTQLAAVPVVSHNAGWLRQVRLDTS
jgi:uncharacterized protein Usg